MPSRDAASTRNLGMCMAADCKRDATNVFHPGRATVLVRFCDEHMESYRKGLREAGAIE